MARWLIASLTLALACATSATVRADDGATDAGDASDAGDLGTLIVLIDSSGSGEIRGGDPGGIDCGEVCSAKFPLGTKVTLTATPAADSAFGGWFGGVCAGTGPCTLTIARASSVIASFVALNGGAPDDAGATAATPAMDSGASPVSPDAELVRTFAAEGASCRASPPGAHAGGGFFAVLVAAALLGFRRSRRSRRSRRPSRHPLRASR